ncbi:hypothetical protein J6590_080708 [Homalodisca vitripennis]|nr:hypothetical protein J6590_080708 [Homalodisca vitripennis]
MDPYLLTRIGDVTIQRVLPKQDAPKKEATVEGQIPQAAGSSLVELDLSMKSRSSMDKAEDEGGGGNFDGANKNFNYSDASEEEDEGDISEEMDEDDEQDVPLSLVTTKRNQDKSVSDSPFSSTDFNVNKPVPSDENRSIGDEVKDFGPSKSVDYNEQLSNDQNKFIEQDKELSETIDNDDDMPLSRLMAGSEHIEEASDAEGESDMDDEKLSVIKEKTVSFKA